MPSPPKAPGKARQVRTMLLKEKNQKLMVKQIGMRIGQKISNGPLKEGTWEDAAEQGALCVSSAASAHAVMEAQPPRQKPFSKKELELLKTQKDFVMSKSWKRPTSFWTMPFKWVCNKSAYDGQFYCGYQRCKHKGFETPRSYKQHLWSKVDSDGHPTQAQLDAYEEDPYVPPIGYKPYGLWDPETNHCATTSMSASEITEEVFQQQKERMLASAKGTPKKKRKEPTSEDEEGSAESVRSSSPMALRVYLEDEGEEEEEEQVEDAPIEDEEGDLEKLRKMKAQSEGPARSESDKPALEEQKEDKKFPLETTSKAMAKPKPKQKASGFTHGGYPIMAPQLIQQKTEQLEHMKETYNYLIETHPAKVSLGETIKEVEAAIENIKKEQAKTRPKAKAYSSRQEADKKVASGRVAYIKERQGCQRSSRERWTYHHLRRSG